MDVELKNQPNSGLSTIESAAPADAAQLAALAETLRDLSGLGYEFSGAHETLLLKAMRARPDFTPPFELLELNAGSVYKLHGSSAKEARVKLQIGGEIIHVVDEGNGPVNAVDNALRKALIPRFPELERVQVADYHVTIGDTHLSTAANPRVVIKAQYGDATWHTVAVSPDIIVASALALVDSYEYFLLSVSGNNAVRT